MRSLLKKLETAFGSAIHVKNFGRSEQLLVEVDLEKMISVSAWLRMEESYRMDFLENLSVCELKGKFIISYFLRSNSQSLQLVLRTSLTTPSGDEWMEHPSAVGIWPQAEPFETEQSALFGIHFTGTNLDPRVKRSFGKFSDFPLRKSFEWGERVEI